MSKGSKVALGFLIAAGIGGGGGYALGPIADSMAARTTPQELTTAIGVRRMQIVEAGGDIQALAPDGGWVPVKAGDSVARPTCIEANGVLSTLRAKLGALELGIGHDARVVIGEIDGALQLDRGHVTVSGGRFTTYVPTHGMKITGTSYGVWAQEKRVVVAVTEGAIEVTRGHDTAQYAAGREVVYQGKTVTPRALEPQLTLNVVDEQKRREDRRVQATSSPAAFVFRKTESGYEQVSVASSGKLTVTLPREPSPGELVAFDAAGRTASLGGAPSPDAEPARRSRPEVQPTVVTREDAPPAQDEKLEKKEKKKKKSANGKKRKEAAERPVEPESSDVPPDQQPPPDPREEGDPPSLMPIEG